MQSYTAIHSSDKHSAIRSGAKICCARQCTMQCKRSLSSLHSCTCPTTLSHFSQYYTLSSLPISSALPSSSDPHHHWCFRGCLAWDNLVSSSKAVDLIKSSRINLFRSYLSFISQLDPIDFNTTTKPLSPLFRPFRRTGEQIEL